MTVATAATLTARAPWILAAVTIRPPSAAMAMPCLRFQQHVLPVSQPGFNNFGSRNGCVRHRQQWCRHCGQPGQYYRHAGAVTYFGTGVGTNGLPANTLIQTTTSNANFAGGSQTIPGGYAVIRNPTGGGGTWDLAWATSGTGGGNLQHRPLAAHRAWAAGNDVNDNGTAETVSSGARLTINSLKMSNAAIHHRK